VSRCCGIIAMQCYAVSSFNITHGSVFPYITSISCGCRLGKLLVGASKETHLRRLCDRKKNGAFPQEIGVNIKNIGNRKPELLYIYIHVYIYIQILGDTFATKRHSKTYPMTDPMKLVDLPAFGSFFMVNVGKYTSWWFQPP